MALDSSVSIIVGVREVDRETVWGERDRGSQIMDDLKFITPKLTTL